MPLANFSCANIARSRQSALFKPVRKQALPAACAPDYSGNSFDCPRACFGPEIRSDERMDDSSSYGG